MKNKLIIDNDNEGKENYKLLLKVSTDEEEYIIYTNDTKNEVGDIICYVSCYNFKSGKQTISPVLDDQILERLDGILMQVQNMVNRNG